MFRGSYYFTLDEKGRAKLPAQFKDILSAEYDSKLVITPHLTDPCLLCFPYKEWQNFENKINLLPTFDETVTNIRRLLISKSHEAPIDSQGRILLPQRLREAANIYKDFVWAGSNRMIEIWAKDPYEAYISGLVQDKDKIKEIRQKWSELIL